MAQNPRKRSPPQWRKPSDFWERYRESWRRDEHANAAPLGCSEVPRTFGPAPRICAPLRVHRGGGLCSPVGSARGLQPLSGITSRQNGSGVLRQPLAHRGLLPGLSRRAVTAGDAARGGTSLPTRKGLPQCLFQGNSYAKPPTNDGPIPQSQVWECLPRD